MKLSSPVTSPLSAKTRLLLALVSLLMLWGACMATLPDTAKDVSHAPPLTLPKVSSAPETPKEPDTVPLAIAATSHQVRLARTQAQKHTLERLSPPGQLASDVVSSASERVFVITQGKLPAAFFGARQRVALAAYSADLVGHYPLIKGKPVSDKAKKRTRRNRLKPGELILTYAKAGKRVRVQLFDTEGRMRPEAYQELSRLFYSPGESYLGVDPWIAFHPRLFTMLYFVAHHFDRPLEVVSAFRVPRRRRRRSSNHWKGRAIDFKVPGVARRKVLRYLDSSFERVGVGWYPNSSFVHLDTRGLSYYWTDRSGPGQRQRNRKRKPRKKARRGTDPTVRTIHLRTKDLYKMPGRGTGRRRKRRRI